MKQILHVDFQGMYPVWAETHVCRAALPGMPTSFINKAQTQTSLSLSSGSPALSSGPLGTLPTHTFTAALGQAPHSFEVQLFLGGS